MEVTFQYFLLLKIVVGLSLLLGAYYLRKKGYNKLSYAALGIFGVLLVFSPVKIDNTHTDDVNKQREKAMSFEHEEKAESEPTVHTKKLSFAEKMAAESNRSQRANEVVQDEIVK